MKKIKSLFLFDKKICAVNEINSFFSFDEENQEWNENNVFPKIHPTSTLLVYKSSLLLEINESELLIKDLKNNFVSVLEEVFKTGISLPDTSIKDDFLCVCLKDEEYVIIDLNSLKRTKFSSQFLLLNTNQEKIIEWNSTAKDIIIKEDYDKEIKIKLLDSYMDKGSLTEKGITITKAVKRVNPDQFVLQANYDFLYRLNFNNGVPAIQKVVLRNTFLGDTISLRNGDYHITNQHIYEINWKHNEAQLLLDWTSFIGISDYSGIKILQTYNNDIIVFLATKKGIVVFYSCISNKIIHFSILNRIVYADTKSIIFENNLYLIDYEGFLHTVSIPKN